MDDCIGDGTTSIIVFTGGLLNQTLELLSKNVHPMSIIRGFNQAQEHVETFLSDISIKIDPKEEIFKEYILKIAKTTLNSKFVSKSLPKFYEIPVNAMIQTKGDQRKIKIIKEKGSLLENSSIYNGYILKSNFEFNIENGRIALLTFELNKVKFQ